MDTRESKTGNEETGSNGFEMLDVAFAFISAVIAPRLGAESGNVEALADALVKLAIEMTGERV